MNNERTNEMLSELNAAIEHDPDRDKNYYQRGLVFKSKGLWEKAEADFAKAFSLWTDPLYLHEWREVAKERQATQTLKERMAPYAAIINKIKDISDDPPPFDDTENISTAELIAALAFFEEYEVLKTVFKSKQFTANVNETVSPAFAYWQPTPLYFITSKKALAIMKDPCKMIRFLSAHGADPNIPAEDGSTMLWNQCNIGYPIEIMKTLLEIGADPNQTSKDGDAEWTPLAYCLTRSPAEDEDGNVIENMWLPLDNEAMQKAELLLKHGATMPEEENMPPPSPRPETAPPISYSIAPGFDQKFEDDFRELFTSRLKEDEDFGSELWSAMANVEWIHEDDPEETRIHRGFRSAGSMIASMLGKGDYIDWYCSGPYETVSEYIAEKMAAKGWRYEVDGEGSEINKGRLSFTDGRLYEGEIEGGKPNGKGKMTLPNEVYEGNFVDGVLQGKGKFTFLSGDFYQCYEGDFVNGKFHGKGKFTFKDDHEYEGDFVEGAFQGKGRWINLRYDDIYEGDFFKGRKHGKGKIIYADGRVYEGDWAKGRYNGHGKMIYADGRVEEGNWKDGEFVG